MISPLFTMNWHQGEKLKVSILNITFWCTENKLFVDAELFLLWALFEYLFNSIIILFVESLLISSIGTVQRFWVIQFSLNHFDKINFNICFKVDLDLTFGIEIIKNGLWKAILHWPVFVHIKTQELVSERNTIYLVLLDLITCQRLEWLHIRI